MKKKVAKIVLIALFAAVSFISYEFDLSWADTGTETEQNIIENAADNVEKEMEFLFIESIELESPGTQNIAVAWDKDMSNITEFTLVYSDSNGKTYTLRESNRTEKSVLFTKEFSSSETGSYKIMGMKYLIEDIEEEQYLDFKDIEVKAEFSIVDKQDDKAAEALEENVATTSTDTKKTTTEVTALLSTANTRAAARNGGNVVVVIDPGHGGSDPGACRNGLREKDLTLKISKYLRDELKEYSGVDVYMTRDTDKALETSPNTELENRVNYAASRNADVLVSIHINAGGGKGAEVWTPNENYNSEIYKEGQKISQDILNELVALGLTNRGVKESYSKDNTTYPDGSLADYYGIIRRSKLAGFTGIIVEHAFIDNASDAAFLKSESNLKKLGVADATGIAEYFGLYKEANVNFNEGTYSINSMSENVRLSVENGSMTNGTAVKVIDKTTEINSSQRFEIIKSGGSEYKILAEHSGRAITVQGASAAEGLFVQQTAWKGNNAQKWQIIDPEDGSNGYYIKSSLGTYLTISSDGKSVVTTNKENAHKWTFEYSESRTVADGIYGIANKTNSRMMLDISGASMADGGNVQMYTGNSTLAQQFDIRYAGNGYYKITTVHSNKSFDVAGGSTETGANIWQYSVNDTEAQLWKFIDAGNGYCYIRSKLGTAIAPISATIKNSTDVEMTSLTGRENQKWMLEDMSRAISDGNYLILSDKDTLRAMTNKNSNVQINVYENIEEQKYNISYISEGYYKITNNKTGKVLEVAGSRKDVEANLREGIWNSGNNQLWKILHTGNNKYCIKSKLGTFVDVSSGSMAENNNIWMYSYNGTEAQKWVLDSSRTNQPVQPIEDGTYVLRSALRSDRVIDISGGSLVDSANVQLYGDNNSSAQRFEVVYVGNGYYKIVNEKSGKSLDVSGGSARPEANLWQYTLNGTDAQLWKFIDAGKGYYYIKSSKGTVIDVASGGLKNGTNIWMYTLNGTDAQKWKPAKTEYSPIDEGTYTFKSGLKSDRAIMIGNATPLKGANIQLGRMTHDANQKFKVEKIDDQYGYYKIELADTGLYLDVENGSVSSGANLQLNTASESAGQLWKFIDAGNGYYYIKSKLGTTIDVTSGDPSIGTNIQLYAMNGTEAQQWALVGNELTPIIGDADITSSRLAAYYDSKHKKYPYSGNSDAPDINAFTRIYIEECKTEGVRADVAFCQAMKETGWLQFGGDVKASQYNFAGLGATGNGNPGNSFKDIRTGIRAHIQHLKAYACEDDLVNVCVDTRFSYVQRGIAPYVEWLGQKENPWGKGWATGKNYGVSIVEMIKEL